MIKRFIVIALTLALAASLFYLINHKPGAELTDKITVGNPLFLRVLESSEFSAVIEYRKQIFAGGIQGLFKIDPDTMNVEEIKNVDQSFHSVRALYLDGEELWLGHDQGISIFSGDQLIRTIGKKDGLKDTRIIDLLRTDEATMYAATFNGIAVIRENGISTISMNDYLPGDSIKIMMKDSFGGLWLGAYNSRGGGVVIDQKREMQFFDISTGLVHNCITTIIETPDHAVLVGGGLFTEGGANRLEYSNGRWTITQTLKKNDGLAGDKVRHIFIDDDGQTWFCSEYDGVAIFTSNGQIVTLTEADGLSSNEVKEIIQDGAGHYWLATRTGVTRIEQDLFNEVK